MHGVRSVTAPAHSPLGTKNTRRTSPSRSSAVTPSSKPSSTHLPPPSHLTRPPLLYLQEELALAGAVAAEPPSAASPTAAFGAGGALKSPHSFTLRRQQSMVMHAGPRIKVCNGAHGATPAPHTCPFFGSPLLCSYGVLLCMAA